MLTMEDAMPAAARLHFRGPGRPCSAAAALVFAACDVIVGQSTGERLFLAGNGDGTFGMQSPLPIDQYVFITTLVAGDVDGDGIDDLALSPQPEGNLMVFLGSR